MVQAEDLSNVVPSLDYTNGIHVYVEPGDSERALQIVNATDDDLEEGEEINPEPDAA